MKRGDIVKVIWDDSCSNGSTWVFEDDFNFIAHDNAMRYITVGFFIRRTKNATYVCESMRIDEKSGGSNLGHLFSIPNVAIKSIKVIKTQNKGR